MSTHTLIPLLDSLQHLTLNVLGYILTMSCLVPALLVAFLPEEWKQSWLVGFITQLQWDAHDWLEEMELHQVSRRLTASDVKASSIVKVEPAPAYRDDLDTVSAQVSASPAVAYKPQPQHRHEHAPLFDLRHRPVSPASLVAAAA